MNKSALLSLIGVSSTGTGLGITALCGGFDGDSTLSTLIFDDFLTNDFPALVNQGQITEDILKQLPYVNLNGSKDIVDQYSKLSCTRYLFKRSKWKNTESENEVDSRLDLSSQYKKKNKDPKYLVLKEKNVTGCLSVWWEKETFTDKKWKGKWNLVWAIGDGKHAIILSSTAKTEEGKLKVDGRGYTLEKKGDRWETVGSQYKEFTEVNKDNKDHLIIRAGSSLEGNPGGSWGFGFDIEKICSSEEECTSGIKTYSKKNWSFMNKGVMEGESKPKNLEDWSTNFGAWSKSSNENALFATQHAGMYNKIKGYFKLISQKRI